MTFKQGQSYQTCYELIDPQQAYSHGKFERPYLNSIKEKASIKVLVKLGNCIFLAYMQQVKILVYS